MDVLVAAVMVSVCVVYALASIDDHGRHIADFGQNLAGWLRITADGLHGVLSLLGYQVGRGRMEGTQIPSAVASAARLVTPSLR